VNAVAERLYCPHCSAVFKTPFSRCPLDGTQLTDLTSDPLVGTTLDGRYEIEECIGEGGMGRVYRAKHPRMSRYYAVKVLFGDHAGDTRMRSRFAREAEGVCRLSHPNVISVTDFGETDEGLLYLVMDLALGRSLAEVIRDEAPLPVGRALSILGQLAKGLAHAHDRGLVHRDFKGENVIMVDEDGHEVPKIVDFGICMIVEDSPAASMLTSNGMVMGTPAVMAPEQASGDTVDHRTDLFSLGIVAYQLISGKLPFEGTPLDMARKNLYEPIPAIAERSGINVDPRIEAIISKLTAKKPNERYQHANDVLNDLAALHWSGTTNADWAIPTPPPISHDDVPRFDIDSSKTVEQISANNPELQNLPPISTEYIERMPGNKKGGRMVTVALLLLVGLGAGMAYVLYGDELFQRNEEEVASATPSASAATADEQASTGSDDTSASPESATGAEDSDSATSGDSTSDADTASAANATGDSDTASDLDTNADSAGDEDSATDRDSDAASTTDPVKPAKHSRAKHSRRNNVRHNRHNRSNRRNNKPPQNSNPEKPKAALIDQVKNLYRSVGSSLDRLERKKGKAAVAALRQDYLDIQYSKIFRGEAAQLQVYNQLRRLSRKIRAAQ
jgi:serine/threonine-protein kinase